MAVCSAFQEQDRFLRIVSWNINGIRTVKNLKSLLDSFDADIICLQETKVTRDMIDEPTALVEGYNAYFSFSRTKSGYSGVATYCREQATPLKAEEGLSGMLLTVEQSDMVGCYGDVESEFTTQELKRLDAEGRAVITQHKIQKRNGTESTLSVINVYCPRADPDRPHRLEFKLRFYRLLEVRAASIESSGSHIVVVGDINTSHRHIDRCENVPQDEFESNQGRQWLNGFIGEANSDSFDYIGNKNFKMVDSFRYFHPYQKNSFTCWNTKINARSTNYGSRIDYVLVDCSLIKEMIDSLILSDVTGSDHCPVVGCFNVKILKAPRCPVACIKNFPEFVGVQQKLSSFLLRASDAKRTAESLEQQTGKKACSEGGLFTHNLKTLEVSEGRKTVKNPVQKDITSFFRKPTSITTEKTCDRTRENSHARTESVPDFQHKNVCVTQTSTSGDKTNDAVFAWRNMLTGPRPPPLCKGHKEPCVERTVKKKGPNFNRKFFTCARGEGSRLDLNARCDHFEWASKK